MLIHGWFPVHEIDEYTSNSISERRRWGHKSLTSAFLLKKAWLSTYETNIHTYMNLRHTHTHRHIYIYIYIYIYICLYVCITFWFVKFSYFNFDLYRLFFYLLIKILILTKHRRWILSTILKLSICMYMPIYIRVYVHTYIHVNLLFRWLYIYIYICGWLKVQKCFHWGQTGEDYVNIPFFFLFSFEWFHRTVAPADPSETCTLSHTTGKP